MSSKRILSPVGNLSGQFKPGQTVARGTLSRSHAGARRCSAFGAGSRQSACGGFGLRFGTGQAQRFLRCAEVTAAMEDRGKYLEGRYPGPCHSFFFKSDSSRCDGRRQGQTTWR
jgi:hypothetical protein